MDKIGLFSKKEPKKDVGDIIRKWGRSSAREAIPKAAMDAKGTFRQAGRLLCDPEGKFWKDDAERNQFLDAKRGQMYFVDNGKIVLFAGVVVEPTPGTFPKEGTSASVVAHSGLHFKGGELTMLTKKSERTNYTEDVDKIMAKMTAWKGHRNFNNRVRAELEAVLGPGAIIIFGDGHGLKDDKLEVYLSKFCWREHGSSCNCLCGGAHIAFKARHGHTTRSLVCTNSQCPFRGPVRGPGGHGFRMWLAHEWRGMGKTVGSWKDAGGTREDWVECGGDPEEWDEEMVAGPPPETEEPAPKRAPGLVNESTSSMVNMATAPRRSPSVSSGCTTFSGSRPRPSTSATSTWANGRRSSGSRWSPALRGAKSARPRPPRPPRPPPARGAGRRGKGRVKAGLE